MLKRENLTRERARWKRARAESRASRMARSEGRHHLRRGATTVLVHRMEDSTREVRMRRRARPLVWLLLSASFVAAPLRAQDGGTAVARSPHDVPARPPRPVATYSIVARDSATGEIGVAVQSHWFSVGSIVS